MITKNHRCETLPDSELAVDDLKHIIALFKEAVFARVGKHFPEDTWEQLQGAILVVFGSWMNDRAIVYRSKYHIPHSWGTGGSVQVMVYGNTGVASGAGVAFTRNLANGRNEFYGEFLTSAQVEDVVAGIRTPEPIASLRKQMPKAYAELQRVRSILETHFKDMQDIEFTIQDGCLFMLQTRNGKRTAEAALKIAVDLCADGVVDWKTALQLIPANQLDQLLAPVFEISALAKASPIASGLPTAPGAACGKIYFNAERAVEAHRSSRPAGSRR